MNIVKSTEICRKYISSMIIIIYCINSILYQTASLKKLLVTIVARQDRSPQEGVL